MSKSSNKKKKRRSREGASELFEALFENFLLNIILWPLRMLWMFIRFLFRSIGDLIP
ncbi:hypothetical protein ACH0BF_06815 [Pseudobacillus sp. 179-B 2D1 NHS]|uniref:hypothetical protein n=1 Tax=Pseudobacillus sp. 179-B 2D1 NHS TaxID=3374292 RepID=UPI00387A4554